MLKKATALFLIILLTVSAYGCGNIIPNAPSAKETFTFTDSLNRTVTVKKQPQRVAALIGSFADVWLLAGGTVCATADDAWDDFGLELPNAVNLGGAHSPSLELLLSSDPDLVIASASTASNIEMKEILENIGVTIAYFDVDCFEDYLFMLDICTEITGRKDLYQKNGKTLEQQINSIKTQCINSDLSHEQRKILLLRASSGSVKAKSSQGTILGEMLSDLGCINIADSDDTLLETLNIESIIRSNPYRIFVVTMGNDTSKAIDNLNKILNENPAWSSLDAVKQNRVHIMDRMLFNIKPNAKWAESYEQLSEILLEKNK